jgi:hypothetical protein
MLDIYNIRDLSFSVLVARALNKVDMDSQMWTRPFRINTVGLGVKFYPKPKTIC